MIYFIRSGDFVKIGVSDNPRGRIAAIQTSNPNPIEVLGIVPGSYELEAELHQRFAHLRHKNEWFRDTKPIRQTIDDLLSKQRLDPQVFELDTDEWRFEVKRKVRKATRKNAGSTAGEKWYYWVIRVHSSGKSVYYGNLGDAPFPDGLTLRLPGVDLERVHGKFRRLLEDRDTIIEAPPLPQAE